MNHRELWKPSKYVLTRSGWRGSRDPTKLHPASRIVADIVAREYERLLKAHARGRLLDHGCGELPLLGMYEDRVEEVVAIDWESSTHDVRYVDVSCDLNKPMPFEAESFDTIVSSDVLEHLHDPVHAMQDLARVLKHGGKLLLNTPFNYWVHEAPHDYFRWTRFAIESLATAAGLVVVYRAECGGSKEVLSDVFLKMLAGRRFGRAVPVVDRLLRATRFVTIAPRTDTPFTLGNVAVLSKP